MARRAKVGLLIDTATSWGSGLIEGVAEFANKDNSVDWHLSLGPRGKYDQMLLPGSWDGDGVIARITHKGLADQIIEQGIPAVNVSWYRYGEQHIPRCTCDEAQIGSLAAKYFIDRGYRQFAYCSSSLRRDYVDRVGQAFAETVRQHTYNCHRYTPNVDPEGFLPSTEDLDRLISWLSDLPKPIGLLAFDSIQARHITEACDLGGIRVPDDVAVLGGEHDHLSCSISRPQLSSIDHSPVRVGFAAAQLLARLMAGEPAPAEPVLFPTNRIITRQSTDTIAVDDELLAACVRFIREHSHERIQVGDILKAVPVSRRALEKGFRKHLSRSPAEEIRRVRVEHAVELLCDTSWPMPRVAAACGFDRPELLTRAFRRELDITPSVFRKQHLKHRRDPAQIHTDDRHPVAVFQ